MKCDISPGNMVFKVCFWVFFHKETEPVGPVHGTVYIVSSSVDTQMSLSSRCMPPQDGKLHIHQSRVVPCLPELPAGFFWYGTRHAGPGRPPKWVMGLLAGQLPASAASGEGTSGENTASAVDWTG